VESELKIIKKRLNNVNEVEFTYEQLADTLNHAIIGIVRVSNKANFLYANKAFCEMIGYTMKELSLMTFMDITHLEDEEKSINIFKKISEKKNKEITVHKKYITKKGGIIYCELTAKGIYDKTGNLDTISGFIINNTKERKNKNNLLKHVIEAQEYERERFAMDIHDGLGQILLAAKMNLSAVNYSKNNLDNHSKKAMINSLNLLREATQEARNISHNLMGRALIQNGLIYAIKDILRTVNVNKRIEFNIKQNIDKTRFDSEVEIGIYRTLQELIKNIIKHSNATKAVIEVNLKKNEILIMVKDNGVGISLKDLVNKKGIGLRNMKSRIDYLGGKFVWDENIKKGTKVNINISI
jgi:PAS domain S-box-containing protein